MATRKNCIGDFPEARPYESPILTNSYYFKCFQAINFRENRAKTEGGGERKIGSVEWTAKRNLNRVESYRKTDSIDIQFFHRFVEFNDCLSSSKRNCKFPLSNQCLLVFRTRLRKWTGCLDQRNFKKVLKNDLKKKKHCAPISNRAARRKNILCTVNKTYKYLNNFSFIVIDKYLIYN